MQYVWQHRLWIQANMRTVDGQRVEVIDPGLINHDAGPDFFNAKIKIDGNDWAGNVEIHVRASDWHRHGHDNDRAYDNVVLHVVGISDARISRSNGQVIPQLVMPCSRDFHERYHRMVDNRLHELACAEEITSVPSIYLTDWLTNLSHERILDKSNRIQEYRRLCDGDWHATAYITLARAMGFSINSDAFERLARATPLRPMLKHSDNPQAIEGLLFGQSGLLPQPAIDEDPYITALRQEHTFMCRKFDIQPAPDPGWRMARTRPQNFPQRRIATLARMIHGGFKLGYSLLDVTCQDDARKLFYITMDGYWANRYTFGPESTAPALALSEASITSLIINVVSPLLYSFGQIQGDTRRMQLALDLLQELKPENNTIVRLFAEAGMECSDALTSQALIQLRRQYCEPRKCLYCRIGHRILAAKVAP